MNPSDYNVEDAIRGVRAIAKALRATPAQVHELRARQGLAWADRARLRHGRHRPL